MSISPFSVRPLSPENERRRARLVAALVALGILASLLAYAISPAVRHAVGHAAHSVKGAVGHVLDKDPKHRAKPLSPSASPATPAPSRSLAPTSPTQTSGGP